MQLLHNGTSHGLSDDAQRVQELRLRPLPEARQRLGVHTQLSFAEGNPVVFPSRDVPPFVTAREPRPKGLIDAFVKTCQRWRLTEREQLVLLGYGDNEFFGTQILRGRWLTPPQDVKDRTGYILAVSLGLGSIFNEVVEAELMWLKTAHEKLAGRTPLTVMLEGKMTALMAVAAVVADERAL